MIKRIILWFLRILKYFSWLNEDFEERYSESANERRIRGDKVRKMYYKI
jgi:hypothetical protein